MYKMKDADQYVQHFIGIFFLLKVKLLQLSSLVLIFFTLFFFVFRSYSNKQIINYNDTRSRRF